MAKKKKTLKGDEGKPDADSGSEALTAEEVSKKYTVAELRYILRQNGLKVSGKKQELVERVLPILNGDSCEEPVEERSDDSQLTEAREYEVKKIILAEPEDSSPEEDVDLTFQDNEELLNSSLSTFGINYEDLPIKDKILIDDGADLKIQGSTQDGLSVSDSTMSITAASDSSNVNLKMNIPEVSYSDFNSTVFTFNDLDLNILPRSNPQTLVFSALMNRLDIITEANYVNLKGLDLFFKSFSEENGICLDIDINSFLYPDFNGTSFYFEDLDFNLSIGLDGQSLAISVNLPVLNLINKDYKVSLSDLNLNVVLSDLKLSALDVSILMSDFHYTNFDDVIVDMNNVDVSLEPISDSKSANVLIRMGGMDATGLNSFDELFPMLNITEVHFKNPTADSDALINLTGSMSLLDISKMDLSSIGSLLSAGFDVDAYTRNMPVQDKSSQDGDTIDVSTTEVSDSEESGFDLGSVFANCDYSCLGAIVLDLTGLFGSIGIDLDSFGIDMSGYDLSAISLSDLIGAVSNSEFIMSALSALLKLLNVDLTNLDMSGLIVGFDKDNFDLSTLLASLNLSDLDVAAILDMFANSDIDLGSIFENCDYSCLDAIKLDLSGLLDSLGIDLASFGIDVSGYDLSAISLSDVIDILSNFDFDISTISSMLKLFGLDLDDIDLSGLIASFDFENFDLSTLLASLNLSDLDISTIVDMFNNSDVDFASIFENCDYSCLGAIELDLTGLLDSAGIDLAEFGIDVSDHDLSAISLSDVIDILSNCEFDMSMLDLSGIDFESLDMSGLISSFDADNFDLSGLLASLNLSDLDISAVLDMFNNSDVDLGSVFENCDYSCLGAIELDLSGLIDSLGIDLASFGIDVSDYDLSAISLSDVIDILSNIDFDMTTVAAALKLFGIDLESLDLSGLINSFDFENFDISALLASLNLSDLDISGIAAMFNNLDVDLANIFENCDYSCLSAIKLDLTKLIDSAGIDLADFGIDASDYDLSAISLSDVIDLLKNSDLMPAITALMEVFSFDLENIDMSGLIVSFDADNFDISPLLNSLDLSGLDSSGIFDNFDMEGFDLTEIVNSLLGMFMENTVGQNTAYDYELICKSNVFDLESLNKLFDMTFINGQLKVCLDDELLFKGDTADDLKQEIFEIMDKYLGEHEISVEFTDGQGKSGNYEEKIMVE
jgi:hypothetical protein